MVDERPQVIDLVIAPCHCRADAGMQRLASETAIFATAVLCVMTRTICGVPRFFVVARTTVCTELESAGTRVCASKWNFA